MYSAVIRKESVHINHLQKLLRGTKYLEEFWQLYYYPHDTIALPVDIELDED